MIQHILKFLLRYIRSDIIPEKVQVSANTTRMYQIGDRNMITRDELLQGREKQFPLTPELEANLTKLSLALNKFRVAYGKSMVVTSGYRPNFYNTAAGGAKKSNHMLCLAADIADKDRSLMGFCLSNIKLLEDCGIWIENPIKTPTWIHMQCVPPKSGNRIFEP